MGELIRRVARYRRAYAVFMNSITDWAGFAVWEDGALVRSVSLSYSDGLMDDSGEPLPFERPFWEGQRVEGRPEDYPFDFHTSAFGNEALRTFFGFVLEGRWNEEDIDPEEISLEKFDFIDAAWKREDLRRAAERMRKA